MKIIFLDIDGVLALMHREQDKYGSLFHEQFVANLKRIIDETGAKIVISSTWRHSGLTELKEMWTKRNLPGEVIDVTPQISADKIYFFDDKTPHANYNSSLPRGIEIHWWLKEIGKFQRINWSKEEQLKFLDKAIVKNYVILDDDSDMLYSDKEHFVKCSCRSNEPDALDAGYGLTSKAANEAIKILNSNLIELYYA